MEQYQTRCKRFGSYLYISFGLNKGRHNYGVSLLCKISVKPGSSLGSLSDGNTMLMMHIRKFGC